MHAGKTSLIVLWPIVAIAVLHMSMLTAIIKSKPRHIKIRNTDLAKENILMKKFP
jgi:hypothetical protein